MPHTLQKKDTLLNVTQHQWLEILTAARINDVPLYEDHSTLFPSNRYPHLQWDGEDLVADGSLNQLNPLPFDEFMRRLRGEQPTSFEILKAYSIKTVVTFHSDSTFTIEELEELIKKLKG